MVPIEKFTGVLGTSIKPLRTTPLPLLLRMDAVVFTILGAVLSWVTLVLTAE